MRKWLTQLTIIGYLGALSFGTFCHTFQFKVAAHPLMYFVVWDMFCGWSAYECRTQIIAEGESGAFYEVAPGPWGDFYPYGSVARRHYDQLGTGILRMAQNSLKQTRHEPITRIIWYDENWAKKFNLPESVWHERFDEPKDPKTYYRVRSVYTPDGVMLAGYGPWLTKEAFMAISENPRLRADSRKTRPFYAVDPRFRDKSPYSPESYVDSSQLSRVSSPLGQ